MWHVGTTVALMAWDFSLSKVKKCHSSTILCGLVSLRCCWAWGRSAYLSEWLKQRHWWCEGLAVKGDWPLLIYLWQLKICIHYIGDHCLNVCQMVLLCSSKHYRKIIDIENLVWRTELTRVTLRMWSLKHKTHKTQICVTGLLASYINIALF